MSTSAESLIPSSQRPIPLVARADIIARPIKYQGDEYWVIKDPLNLEYYRLQPEQYFILQLLDGRRSTEDIQSEFTRRFPTRRPTLAQVHTLIFDLYRQGLVSSTRPGQGDVLARRAGERRWKKLSAAARNLLFIRVPGFDPHRLIQGIYPAARWIFHPAALVMAALIVLSACGLLVIRFDDFQQRLPDAQNFLSWRTLLSVWLTLGAVKILHEMGHALACRHFGGECHEIGLAFLVFSPCLYCDVSDSWVLPSKWKRIAIGAAGMYIEMVLSSVALLAWWNTREGMLHHTLLNVFLVSCVTTIVFNLNPLLRLDGYYMLSDWLEIPNLRQKADQLFEQFFARLCLGIRAAANPFLPQHGRFWFVLFSAASAVYRWFLVFGISYVLYQSLKPYKLQNLGLLLGVVSVVIALVSGIRRVSQLIGANRDQARLPVRPAISLAVATGCVLLALFVPLPLHVAAPLVIEPFGAHHVYTSTPGRVVAVHVQPGEHVRRGQVLVELSNAQKLDRYRKLRTAQQVQQVEVTVQQALADATQETLAAETLRAVGDEVDDYRRQLDRLVIVAPCDGIVVAAPTVARDPAKSPRQALSSWHGTPLDPPNESCFLEAGTHLLSVAPDQRFQAVLLIDQLDRPDFGAGSPVKLKVDHLPQRTFRSQIERIATATLDPTSANPTHVAARGLRAAASSDGALQADVAYQATVTLDSETERLVPGMTGQARVLVARRTAAQWLWRYVRNTFNFHM